MINRKRYRAKALYFRSLTNHGLKAVVSDSEMTSDFSPKSVFLNTLITIICK
jgi:hypothetical protein